jgi:hypothetical protein
LPSYRGLTEVIEHPEVGVPPGIEDCFPQCDLAEIHAAARRCCDLLIELWPASAGDLPPIAVYTRSLFDQPPR